MTCIVSVKEGDSVYIGGDSAGIAGLSITIRNDEKVFQNGPFIMGFTSSFRMGQLLRYKFDPPQQTVHQDDMQYMVTDFVDGLRRCFSANGFGDKDATVGGTFLVGYKGQLYTIESDYQVGIPNTPYDAVGCGADLALGSLHSTSKMKLSPEQRIVMALEAASTFSAGVAPPFLIIQQEAPKPQKAPRKTAAGKVQKKSTAKSSKK
jgi:ATP-dependent protease HslVU (ClpYQ) peptidase subunit